MGGRPKGLPIPTDIRRHGSPCRPTEVTSAAGVSRPRSRTIEAIGAIDDRTEPRSGGEDVTRDDPDREEYAGWGPPQGGGNADNETNSAGRDPSVTEGSSDETGLRPPTELRGPLLRDRLRDRLGVTPRQWYVIETLLLVSPYPVFVFVYVTVDVNETVFLTVTLLYSLVATYVGILS
ncbi:hypothetical protein DQW50_04440 [Halorubrum sp. 48-1-W]|nr:hypothetical protein DQW50_04440 [Halorubrum sp. 48-1-W]